MEKSLFIFLSLISLGLTGHAEKIQPLQFSADSIGQPVTDAFHSDFISASETAHPTFGINNPTGRDSSAKKRVVRNGLYVVFNDQGDTQFVVNYKKGQLKGEWTSWFNNRRVCDSGMLVNGQADGTWKGWYVNGNPRYILHFSARKLNGLKTELLNQPKTKYFILAQKSAVEASRHYNARLLFGHATPESKSNLLSLLVNHPPYSPEFLGKLVAANTSDDPGNYTPPFTEGLLHGSFASFYPNGSVKQTGLYLNGLREGIWEEYSQENEKAVGTYRHGYRKGEWKYYDAKGRLVYWKRFDAKGKESEKFSFADRED